MLLFFHEDGNMEFGKLRQRHSQDTDPNVTCFGWRPIRHGRHERFLSVLVPHTAEQDPADVAARIQTQRTSSGDFNARIAGTVVKIQADGGWSVSRKESR